MDKNDLYMAALPAVSVPAPVPAQPAATASLPSAAGLVAGAVGGAFDEREPPIGVADRAHWLAMVAAPPLGAAARAEVKQDGDKVAPRRRALAPRVARIGAAPGSKCRGGVCMCGRCGDAVGGA